MEAWRKVAEQKLSPDGQVRAPSKCSRTEGDEGAVAQGVASSHEASFSIKSHRMGLEMKIMPRPDRIMTSRFVTKIKSSRWCCEVVATQTYQSQPYSKCR